MIKSLLLKKYFFYALGIIFFFSNSMQAAEKKKLKILMVVPCFPKIHDICMLNQITGLIDRGHDVFIYAPKSGDLKKVQKEVIAYNLLSKTIIGEFPRNVNSFDIIVFQLGHKAFNVKRTHNFKGKVVVCLRGYDITGFIQGNEHAYDDLFNSCDLFMPVCNAFKNILQKLGCNPKKIMVHYSGIDCSRFTFKMRRFPKYGPINIISVGRFVEKKGFIYSIEAIAQLIKQYPSLRYTIIGEGALKTKYKRLIRKLGIDKYVNIDGWHTHDEYIKLLDRSHIFVLPSVTAENNDQEGIPNVIKEAMAMGILVVATDHSGVSELIEDKVSGYLVPEHSSNAIVHAIDYILKNPSEWASTQHIGRLVVSKKFDTEKVNNKLEEIFLNLMKD